MHDSVNVKKINIVFFLFLVTASAPKSLIKSYINIL